MTHPNSNSSPIHGLIFDMDGVLWRGSQLLVDMQATFQRITDQGWRIVLASNNSTRTIDYYLEKMDKWGVSLQPAQVLNSALATALHMKAAHPQGGPVYIVGEWGLEESLARQGFLHSAEKPLAVIAGLDRRVTYEKLRQATLLIRAGVPFIGTNPDPTFPTPEGLVPGAGAILASIQAATDVAPQIIGKPHKAMFKQALANLETTPRETLMVGDRLTTDIAGGQAAGCQTALLLSGVTTPAQAEAWHPAPNLIAPDLNTLLDQLTAPVSK